MGKSKDGASERYVAVASNSYFCYLWLEEKLESGSGRKLHERSILKCHVFIKQGAVVKDVEKLKKILGRYNLSDNRKEDLIEKYRNATPKLQKEMEEYFGFSSRKKSALKNKKLKRDINATAISRKPVESGSSDYGSRASLFDHRVRPTTDAHYDLDKNLDEEFFKNK